MQATMLSGDREFRRVELPEPEPEPGMVLVRVGAVSICGSDLHGYLGGLSRFKAPTILGHELAGTIERLGAGVSACQVGDRVFVDSILGCGACRRCADGRRNICPDYRVMGQDMDLPGGLAGLLAVPAANVSVLPASVPLEVGAIVQPLSVAYHACIDQGQVGTGDTVVVFGAGTIGDGILLAAKSVGAHVIMVDPVRYRLELAGTLGADVLIDPTAEDVVEIVQQATDGEGADVVLEAVGGNSDEVLTQAMAATGRGGRIVVLGLKLKEGRIHIDELKEHEKTLIGSQAYPIGTPAEVVARIADGTLPADQLITHRRSFEQVGEAFGLLERGGEDVLKIVLRP